jgi:hypothetical protein
MGLPTSWAILSLIHLFWMDEVRKCSGVEARRFRFHICGDDALLLTNARGAARYKELVRDCGGEPSPGKHFEPVVRSFGRAVFLERLYEFELDDGIITEGSLLPAMPVKGVTSVTLPREFRGELPVRAGSNGIVQLIVLDSL